MNPDFEWTPGTLLAISGSYWQTLALHAGVKLDVFSVIGGLLLTGEEIAQAIEADPRGTKMLLDALAAMELIQKSENRYANTPTALKYLSQDSPDYLGYMILHHYHLVDSWRQLPKAVRTGSSVDDSGAWSDAERRENFLMGMFNNARLIAPKLVQEIDLSGRKHLLDLGGGPGTYAIHFCLRNPELKATVFDLPTTQPFAERVIDQFQVGNQVSFQGGDYLTDEIVGTYDVVWLSHILHAEGPKDCRRLLRKAVLALDRGGLIFVHDFILNESRTGPLFPALFSLNMLLRTDSGQSYSESEIIEMLSSAGIEHIQRLPFVGPTESGIIMGVLP